MKKSLKITKLQLDLNDKEEFFIIGIVSGEADYKLSLAINRKLELSLKSLTPLNIPFDNGTELSFGRFSDKTGSPELVITLISNRSANNFLIKKLKNIDYILLLHDTESVMDIPWLTSGLKEIEAITAIFNLELTVLKNKDLNYLMD